MWTEGHRQRQLAFERQRRYPADLTDEEWARIEPLLPKPAKLRPVETAVGPPWSYGLLPAHLIERVRDGVVARARARTLRAVPRTE